MKKIIQKRLGKYTIKFFFILCMVFFSILFNVKNSLAYDAPCEIQHMIRDGDSYLIITSKVDSLTINSLKVNRGNCNVALDDGDMAFLFLTGLTGAKKGKMNPCEDIKFGNQCKVKAFCKRILEVQVSTDQGDYSFSYE